MQIFHHDRLLYTVEDAHVIGEGDGVYDISFVWENCPFTSVEQTERRDSLLITERQMKYRGRLTQLAQEGAPWVTITARRAA